MDQDQKLQQEKELNDMIMNTAQNHGSYDTMLYKNSKNPILITKDNIESTMRKIISNSIEIGKGYKSTYNGLQIPVDLIDEKDIKKLFLKKQLGVLSDCHFNIDNKQYDVSVVESDTMKNLIKTIDGIVDDKSDDMLLIYSLNKNIDVKKFVIKYVVVENYKKTFINNSTIKNIINIKEILTDTVQLYGRDMSLVEEFDTLDVMLGKIINTIDALATISPNNRIFKYDKSKKIEDVCESMKELAMANRVSFNTIIVPYKLLSKYNIEVVDKALSNIDDIFGLDCDVYVSNVVDDILIYEKGVDLTYYKYCLGDKYVVLENTLHPQNKYKKLIVKYN